MTLDHTQLLNRIKPLIGNTPLLEIGYTYEGKKRRIFAKAEYYNLTGSIKDRVALYILEKAYEKGIIKPGDTVAEATSGNTGISFSALGRYLGHPVTIYMPDWMSRERIALMESFGATVRLVSAEEGGFLGSIQMTEDLAKEGHVFLPRQFSNEDNTMAHIESTGTEIVNQLKSLGLTADGVVAGVGTGGTIMGIARRLRKENENCKAFPLEPSNSPTLSTGYKVGKHRIYGISDEFIPDILKLPEMNEIVSVDDGDAIKMARLLSESLGIGVGVSGGANFLGAIKAQDILGDDAVIVTVFADDNKKYLSTDYAKAQEPSPDSITDKVTLHSLNVVR
ncbi:MAG: cysteine synthase family protein [Clostridia bacterium]|nr:cysteine synthase family protein [Clostridia bacterium]